MSCLLIRLSKKPDGSTVLTCIRPDGSRTWQRHHHHAAFFPLHDLMHFAVETTLNLRYGFYGLLANGWNISDFGKRVIPAYSAGDAALAETVVGLLDGERSTGICSDIADFNEALSTSLNERKLSAQRTVTNEELEGIRDLWRELAARWADVASGARMELAFELASPGGIEPSHATGC